MLHGRSRLDRPTEKFCWVYVRLPIHPIYCSKNGLYVDLKDILQKGFKSSKNICLYMIFDSLSVSFRYAVKLRDCFYS